VVGGDEENRSAIDGAGGDDPGFCSLTGSRHGFNIREWN
jgi:hypothetical protein